MLPGFKLVLMQGIQIAFSASSGSSTAPSAAAITPLRELQNLQQSFLRRACRVKKSVPVDIIFQELAVTRWRDFWWRQVLSFWSAMLQADPDSICSLMFHDSVALAHDPAGWLQLWVDCASLQVL